MAKGMTITSVETQVKNPERVSVFIDGEFSFGISAGDALYYKLNAGEEISGEKYAKIMDELVLTKAKNHALSYLGFRARTEKEMRVYLSGKEYGGAVTDEVIELLYKYKYLDDYEFAKTFVSESLRLKKWGFRKIEYELRLKGVDSEIISRVWSESEIDQTETILHLLDKKCGSCNFEEMDFKEKRRIVSYLQGRGFAYGDIEEAIAKRRQD
ncbi:MAG: RecX family transcriptional regulator [Clostridiales bacterium]|jgi:regulatory protein|nr:RecX family transcriptional regulator [Clostridiales bacterium]